MTPVKIPGNASFTTMRLFFYQHGAHREILTVRNACGTERSASSAVLMMTGSVMIESVREAARIDVPKFKKRKNNPKPNSPYTTDGIPARLMIAMRMVRVSGVSDAY